VGSVDVGGECGETERPGGRSDEKVRDGTAEEASILSPVQREELEGLLKPSRAHFGTDKIGCAKGILHHIDTGDAPPVQHRYQSYNPRIENEAGEEVRRRLELGLVERSDSPYCSPLLRLKKKSGKARWVVDYRKLNSQIRFPNANQLPRIRDLLMRLKGAAIISSLDVRDAYLQIPLDEESKKKTAFYVPGEGLFHFTRLPAGLKDAAGRWHGYIQRIVGHDDQVLVYMDDILIFSYDGDWEGHKLLLKSVLDKLVEANITVNLEKSVFGRKETLYLGHIIDKYGIRPDPAKIAAVAGFPRPRKVRQVRQFLGLAGWMRKYVQNFSAKARPLTVLTQKDRKFEWGPEEEGAFVELKKALCSHPILRSSDFNKPFRMYTDGSASGTGGVLVQEDEGQERVIAYSSRALTSREERNFSATELELLAMKHAFEAFRPYLEGSRFELVTDHSSLRWLLDQKDPKG